MPEIRRDTGVVRDDPYTLTGYALEPLFYQKLKPGFNPGFENHEEILAGTPFMILVNDRGVLLRSRRWRE